MRLWKPSAQVNLFTIWLDTKHFVDITIEALRHKDSPISFGPFTGLPKYEWPLYVDIVF